MTEAMKNATREVGYPNLKPNQLGALNVIKGDIILHEAIIVACYHTCQSSLVRQNLKVGWLQVCCWL